MRTRLLVLGVILAAASCATRAKTGAAIGAGSGAAIGAGVGATIGGKKGAIAGAAVGAATGAVGGALIGRYMDKQQKELEREVKAAKIERKGDKLLVKFSSAILFDVNEAELKPEAKKDLAELAGVLKEYDDTDLVIEGHTDSTGPRDFNEQLSLDRAQAVIEFLADQGVSLPRMTARGFADARPVASNTEESGRKQNRRVQVQIAANEQLQQKDAAAARQQKARTGPARAAAPTGR